MAAKFLGYRLYALGLKITKKNSRFLKPGAYKTYFAKKLLYYEWYHCKNTTGIKLQL